MDDDDEEEEEKLNEDEEENEQEWRTKEEEEGQQQCQHDRRCQVCQLTLALAHLLHGRREALKNFKINQE